MWKKDFITQFCRWHTDIHSVPEIVWWYGQTEHVQAYCTPLQAFMELLESIHVCAVKFKSTCNFFTIFDFVVGYFNNELIKRRYSFMCSFVRWSNYSKHRAQQFATKIDMLWNIIQLNFFSFITYWAIGIYMYLKCSISTKIMVQSNRILEGFISNFRLMFDVCVPPVNYYYFTFIFVSISE